MKQHSRGVILLLCVLITLTALGLIYWYKYRPSDIRALCAEEEKVNARPRPPWDQNKKRMRTYQECLEDHGVDK